MRNLSFYVMHFTPTLGGVVEQGGAAFPRHHRPSAATGVTSVPEWVAAIDAHVDHQNTRPKSFVWGNTAADILQKFIRASSWFDE